jgi:hypothetical protein
MELNDKYSLEEYKKLKEAIGETADIAEKLADHMEKSIFPNGVNDVKGFFKQTYNEVYPPKTEKKNILSQTTREHDSHVIDGVLHILRKFWKYGFLVERVDSRDLFYTSQPA